jgi:hypothetical protein
MAVSARPAPASVPEGRYSRPGRAAGGRRARALAIGAGVVQLAVVGWICWHAADSGSGVNGQVLGYRVRSAHAVSVRVQVDKKAGRPAVCTLSSQSKDHEEVGRRDVWFRTAAERAETSVVIRTFARGVSAELAGCRTA